MREGSLRARASYLMFLPKAWNLSIMTLLNGNKFARCKMTSPKVCCLPFTDVWDSQQAACLVQREGKVSMQHMRPTAHGVENAKKDRDGSGSCSMFTTGSITRINTNTSADFIQVYTVHSLWATAYLFVQNLPIRPSNSSPSKALSFASIQQPQLHMFIQRNSLRYSDHSKTESPRPSDMIYLISRHTSTVDVFPVELD